jgi:hypothetical protein
VTLSKGFLSPSTIPQTVVNDDGIVLAADDHVGFTELNKAKPVEKQVVTTEYNYQFPHPMYFWNSVLIFPLLAVICIVLILVLSVIFFGRREGQQWRDYKTPKEQLHEYLNVREGQRQLRELSVQRQMLLMSGDRSKSNTPLGVQAFLQPRGGSQTPATQKRNPIGGSQSKLAERRANSSMPISAEDERFPLLNPRSSVGKQTVAEAAGKWLFKNNVNSSSAATGSNLNLYRNPLNNDDELEERNTYR